MFRGDADWELFLTTLGQAVAPHGLRVHAYCLMLNHYHLVVETARGNLSRALGWLQTTYTIRLNRRHRRSVHFFQGCFSDHESVMGTSQRYPERALWPNRPAVVGAA